MVGVGGVPSAFTQNLLNIPTTATGIVRKYMVGPESDNDISQPVQPDDKVMELCRY